MNRSYSKIRHIQESNLRLEKRLREQDEPTIEPTQEDEPIMDSEYDTPSCKKFMTVKNPDEIGSSPMMTIENGELENFTDGGPNYYIYIIKNGKRFCKITKEDF